MGSAVLEKYSQTNILIMTCINLEWVENNFANKNIVIYDIGVGDLSDQSLRFKFTVPYATVYSFECSEKWREHNYKASQQYGLNYIHKAVSYQDGIQTFTEGITDYSGTLTEIKSLDYDRIQDSHIVDVITIDTFCQTNPPPDLLHVCAEKEEYNIIRAISPQYLPSVMWFSKHEHYNDENYIRCIPFSTLKDLVEQNDYHVTEFEHDFLCVKNHLTLTEYKYTGPYAGYWSDHEKKIQEKIWLFRYNLVKSDGNNTWPELYKLQDWFDLPNEMKIVINNVTDLTPSDLFFS